MEFQVYYRAWPNKTLRQITAEAVDAATAVKDVADMLKEEKEMYFKPLIAMIVGGKQ